MFKQQLKKWQSQQKQLSNQSQSSAKKIVKLATRELSDIDLNFQDYCQQQQVKPLAKSNSADYVRKPKQEVFSLSYDNLNKQQWAMNSFEFFDESSALDEYYTNGQINLPMDLRKGKYKVTQSIDLHNHSKTQALEVINELIDFYSKQTGICLKIIHGQGTNTYANEAILLKAIRKYLAGHPAVLGYSYAIQSKGGNGVTLVKLRKIN